MSGDIDPDRDLHAYVDGQLGPERRLAVEVYLASDPAAAVRVHEYLRQKAAIRAGLDLLAGTPDTGSMALAERLHRRLRYGHVLRHTGRIAAAVLLVTVGWAAGSRLSVPEPDRDMVAVPTYADEAARAHAAALEADQPEGAGANGDPQALAQVLARLVTRGPIHLPGTEAALTLLRVSLLPSTQGTALQLLYREPDGEVITLFVAAGTTPGVSGLHAVDRGGLRLIYWQSSHYVYSVAGNPKDDDLMAVAAAIAAGLS